MQCGQGQGQFGESVKAHLELLCKAVSKLWMCEEMPEQDSSYLILSSLLSRLGLKHFILLRVLSL